jgi:hypothetical protein
MPMSHHMGLQLTNVLCLLCHDTNQNEKTSCRVRTDTYMYNQQRANIQNI